MSEQGIDFDRFDIPVAWEDIPDSDIVEAGEYVLRVRELKMVGSREGEKLMVMCMLDVDEGVLTGVPFPIQNFVLGSEDDPQCDQDTGTMKKSFGGRQLKQLLNAVGVQFDGRSLRLTLNRAQGGRFRAYVTKGAQKSGEYAGQDQNRITKFVAYGQSLKAGGVPGGIVAAQAPREHVRPQLDPDAVRKMMAERGLGPLAPKQEGRPDIDNAAMPEQEESGVSEEDAKNGIPF